MFCSSVTITWRSLGVFRSVSVSGVSEVWIKLLQKQFSSFRKGCVQLLSFRFCVFPTFRSIWSKIRNVNSFKFYTTFAKYILRLLLDGFLGTFMDFSVVRLYLLRNDCIQKAAIRNRLFYSANIIHLYCKQIFKEILRNPTQIFST